VINIAFDREHILRVIDAMVKKTMQMDLRWDWACGVAYYGVSEAIEVTQREEYLEALQNRIDEYMGLGLPGFNVNTCSMGHCLITLYEHTRDEKYLGVAQEKLNHLRQKAIRFSDRVLQHTVSGKNDFPEQAWADTLFMAALFMLRMGVMQKDEDLIADALNQFFWHIEYLQEPAEGVWFHGYNNLSKDHMSGHYWARGNAWASYTMALVGRILPEPYLYPQFMDITCALRDQLSGLKNYQTENGLWRTVLDDEDSYEELSASAGIAAAMLVSGNPLHTSYAQRALKGVLKNVTGDGRMLNVSGGTAVMRDLEGYRQISRKWVQGWGQGLGLAFLAELLNEKKSIAI